MRAHLPAHVSVRSGNQLLNSHEGAKVPEAASGELFREIPLEASVRGHQVAMPRSDAPNFGFERRSGEITVSIDGTEYTVDEGGQLKEQITVDSGIEQIGEVSLSVRLNDLGPIDVLSHPTKSVVPVGERTAEHYKQITKAAQGSPGEITVTEIKNEDVLLVDHGDGGDEQ